MGTHRQQILRTQGHHVRKKVKEYLEILPEETDDEGEKEPSRWKYLKLIPKFVYDSMMEWEERMKTLNGKSDDPT